jgi:hypothetical protein
MKTTTNTAVDLLDLLASITDADLAAASVVLDAARAADAAIARRVTAAMGGAQGVRGNCPRCGGLGKIHGFEHVQGGSCFRCFGTGVDGAAF